MVEHSDYAESIAESGLFLSPDHRRRFLQLAGMLSAGGGSVLVTGQSAVLAEHYGLMLREVLLGDARVVVENYLPGSSTALLTRFNAIVGNQTVAQARGLETQPAALRPVHLFLVHDPDTFDADETELLARLLTDFPGARVRLLLLDSGGGEVVPRLQRLFRQELQVWSIDAPDTDVLATSRAAAEEAGDAAGFDALLNRAGMFCRADESQKESTQTDAVGEPELFPGQSEAADVPGLPSAGSRGSLLASTELAALEVAEASRWRLAAKTSPKARLPLLLALGAALLMLMIASLPLSRSWVQQVAERTAQAPRMPAESDTSSAPQSARSNPVLLPPHDSEQLALLAAPQSDVFYLPEPPAVDPAAPSGVAVSSSRMGADDGNGGSPSEATLAADESATSRPPVEADLDSRLKQGMEALLAAAETTWFVQNHLFTEAPNAMGWIQSVEAASLPAGVPLLIPGRSQGVREQWLAVIGPFEDVAIAERFVQDHGAEVDYWIRSRQALLEVLEQPLEDG